MSAWKCTELGEVMVERQLAFRRGGRSRAVRVLIGRPVRGPAEDSPWACPVALEGLSSDAVRAIYGYDSLQALLLALVFLMRTLPALAKKAGGRLTWLDEREEVVFASTRMLDIMSTAHVELVIALRDAGALLNSRQPVPSARRRAILRRVDELLRRDGFPRRTRRGKRSN
jgi:hypothetical protein